MNYYKGTFSAEEENILKKHRILINDNQRYYLHTDNDVILEHGCPIQYKVEDFYYEGTSWKSLLLSFGNWVINKSPNIEELVNLRTTQKKVIFSQHKETNFIGPLNNELYINSNLGVFSWMLIINLLTYLNIVDKGVILIHYPFHRECKEIGKLVGKKEINMFYKYLLRLGYPEDIALKHITNLKKMFSIYKELKKYYSHIYGWRYITNPFFITADNMSELSNAISKIKKSFEFKKDYLITLDNLVDFKKNLIYENKNYSNYIFK